MTRMQEKFIQKVRDQGLCDERGAAFCATATTLPNGLYGMVLLSVCQDRMLIHTVDLHNNAGAFLYDIPLREITEFKVNESILKLVFGVPSLRFSWRGKPFVFTYLVIKGMVKEAVQVILDEMKK